MLVGRLRHDRVVADLERQYLLEEPVIVGALVREVASEVVHAVHRALVLADSPGVSVVGVVGGAERGGSLVLVCLCAVVGLFASVLERLLKGIFGTTGGFVAHVVVKYIFHLRYDLLRSGCGRLTTTGICDKRCKTCMWSYVERHVNRWRVMKQEWGFSVV